MSQEAQFTYVGQEGGPAPEPEPQPDTQIDLRRVAFGTTTFENPCFWILVGVVGTVTVQYLWNQKS